MIYFDNSATTPLDPEVIEAMLPYLQEVFGNPSGKYYTQAEDAKKAVDTARDHVAKLLSCGPDEVIFTSGATESNNLILKGIADYYSQQGNHIVTTKAEHPSILETATYLENKGYKVTYLNVDSFARASYTQFEELLSIATDRPLLLSLIWGNNEVGSLNDIERFSSLCREYGVFFHTDATQVLGKVSTNMRELGIQFLSCSAHKIHGPKGIGACVIRKHEDGYRTKITPLIHGGEQEGGYRSGTLSVHNIVGFGKAAEIAYRDLQQTHHKLRELEHYFTKQISVAFPTLVELNSDRVNKIPGIINLRFQGVNNELLIKKLAQHVALSTGSACSSSKPSHVLQSMGMSLDKIRSSLRISLSKYNSTNDIDTFITLLKS